MCNKEKLILGFVVAFLFFCFLGAFAQEENPPPVLSGQTKAHERLVTAIEVKGNKSISPNVILSKIKTKIGSPYMENVISDDLKRLYLLGFFSDIRIDTEDYQEGVKVIITVVEKPVIEKISFEGMVRLYYFKPEKLKEQIKSKEGQYLDQTTLKEDTQVLKGIYEKKGFSQAQVDYRVEMNPETGKALVTFVVDEGVRLKVKKIYVKGNQTFKAGRILKLLKTKTAWLFNPGTLKEEVFQEDIERIKSFYKREGFSDVEVDYRIERDPQKPFIYITIEINEGKRYYVGEVRISGNKDISEAQIRSKLKAAVPGMVYSDEAVQEDINNILSIYFDQGYIMANVADTASLNPQTGKIDIDYKIVENEVAYVNKIKIRGNIKTKDVVIRREMRIFPGDRFDGQKLRRSKEKLNNLGFFEEVSYQTEPTSEPNKRDLVVEVKEAKTGSFSFGGGYSTVDQLIGFVEIEQKNFDWKNFPYFTGAGQDLKLRAQLGNLSQGFDFSFTEPWVFDYPISFGFDAYKRKHDRDKDVGYGYAEDVTGGDLRLGKIFSDYWRMDIMYKYDTIKISDIDPDATADLRKEAGKNSISSIILSSSFDSRDNVFDTHRGNVLSASVQYAGLGGDKEFVKFFGRVSHFFPLFKNSTLETRLRIGMGSAYGDSKDIPIYERFFAGGTYTIRGYDERSIGPIDPVSKSPLGGEALLVGNLEYTYPLLDFLKLAAFYDTGNVWKRRQDLGSGKFYSGFGFGFMMKTPIGPVALYYGIPVDKQPGEDRKSSGKIHFSMSRGF